MAPEVVNRKGHGTTADWWSFGVLMVRGGERGEGERKREGRGGGGGRRGRKRGKGEGEEGGEGVVGKAGSCWRVQRV